MFAIDEFNLQWKLIFVYEQHENFIKTDYTD